MRHGKAESGGGQPDQERTLVEKGWAQARLVGEYLESQGVRPTRVLVSDAERTRETWEGVQASMPGFDGKVTFHEEIYSGGTGEVLELIRETKPDAVLNSVDPVFNVPLFDACFEAGVTYLDMAMTLSEPHPERPFELTGVKLGDYQFECSFHVALGQIGTMTVTSA